MADDQVKYTDLFDAGIVGEVQNLTKEITALKGAIAAAKTEANGLRDGLRGAGTATRDQQQATAADAQTVEALKRQVQDLTDKLNKLEERKKRLTKLTNEEAAAVEALRRQLEGEAQDQIDAVKAIDIQVKSYNELYQTYNAIKDALNKMTTAERENSAAGKEMVERAKEIRDTLNRLQQATGVYTLNVGNYASAMNGLKMQFQQIAREIPSAQNAQQFFLAISNNVPMFADALARYKKELPEIKDKFNQVSAEITRQRGILDTLVEGSTEHEQKLEEINGLIKKQKELSELNVSPMNALWQAAKSWQTKLIAALVILRQIPKLIQWIKENWNEWLHGVQLVKNEMNALTAKAQVYSDVLKKTNDEIVKLDMVVERLKQVDRGTKEWKDGIALINDITKSNLDAVKATKEEIERVTEAYKEQAIQIATNDIIAEKIAKSRAQKALVKAAMEADTLEGAMELAGFKPDSKEGKKFMKAWNAYNATRPRNYIPPTEDWLQLPTIQSDLQVPVSPVQMQVERPEIGTDEKNKVESMVRAQFQDMIDEESERVLQQMIKPVKPLKKEKTPKGTGAGISYNNNFTGVTMADIALAEANALQDKGENALQTIELWYAKKSAIAEASYKKDIETLDREEEKKKESLEESVLSAKVFVAKYNDAIAKLDAQHAAGALDDDEWSAQKKKLEHQYTEATTIIKDQVTELERIEKYYGQKRKIAEQKRDNELLDLQAEYEKKKAEYAKKKAEEQAKADKENAKAKLKAEADNWERLKAQMVEQGKSRRELIEAEFNAEIARLRMMLELNRTVNGEIMSDEEKAKVKEWINLLEQIRQKGNYKGIKSGQVFGAGGAKISTDRSNYSSAMQMIADVLDVDITSEQISALNNVFDQAKDALNSWMDARKAAADQAKALADDEVSAAENALNREIELRNQGYANDVALRERELADAKKAQEEAAKQQKKIAQEQIKLDAAMQASSMITASANIIKQFPNPAAWIPMLAMMWGAFSYAKVKAYQEASNTTKYREGGYMLLEGGSHQSGHDVNLGIGPDGSNLRAEGGEYFAVINKCGSRKYGSEIPGIVNALNSGMFEDRYIKTSDAVGMLPRVIATDNGYNVDLSAVENGVGELVRQGERSWSTEGEYRVMRYKNLTRRVRVR